MTTDLTKIGKHSLIYGAGLMLSKAASFLMLPIYTHYLSPSDYGVAELLGTSIDIISMIAGVGIGASFFKFYFENDDDEERRRVVSTSVLLLFFLALITLILGVSLSSNLSTLVFGRNEYSLHFQLIFFIYFLQHGIITIPLLYIRAREKANLFVYISLAKLCLQVTFNIIFLVVMKIGLLGIFYSTLIAEIIIGSYLTIYTLRGIELRFFAILGKKILRFGYPFIMSALFSFVITFSDRYFLKVYTSLNAIGIYSLAYKFGFVMTLLGITPFLQVWDPMRFEIAKKSDGQAVFQKVFLYYTIVIVLLSLAISLFVKDVIRVMADPSFWEAYKVAPIIICAYIFQGWTFFCSYGILHGNKSKQITYAYFIAAIVVTILNATLIPLYEVYGAAWATLCGFVTLFVIVNAFSQKNYEIDYMWKKNFVMIACAVGIYLVSSSLSPSSVTLSIAINSGFLFLFATFVYSAILCDIERQVVFRFARKAIRYPILLFQIKS